MTNVYFISGMGASCKVFDKVQLPDSYKKIYIEWIMPEPEELLESYTKKINYANRYCEAIYPIRIFFWWYYSSGNEQIHKAA